MTSTAAIINWNSGRLLRPCVESLLATTTGAQILVVDNASEDESLESIRGFQHRIDFIRNSVNRGFAAAVNQAFHATSSSYVLLLNPDVRVTPGAVQALEDLLNVHPHAAAAGGDVGEKYWPKPFPTLWTLVRENLGLVVSAAHDRREQAVLVDQPAAAALMIRRDAFEDVGGFDEQFYPAWYEDVDFCRRVKEKGWEIYFAPNAKFVHEGGYSAGAMGAEHFLRSYYGNQLRYARKHFRAIDVAVLRASIAAGMLARMIGKPEKAAAYGKAFFAVFRGR
jgi:GT2 family glycosyltransferase